MTELISSFAGAVHSLDAAFIECSDVYIQSAADSCDIFDILRLVRHYRASATREKHVSYIIYRYIVCDVVDQWHIHSYVLNTISKHILLLVKLKKQICL